MLALSLGQSAPYVRSRVEAGDPSTQCLYWTVPKITWYQSSAGNPQTRPQASEFDAVRRSFQGWRTIFDQCGNLSLEEGGVVDDRKVGYVVNGDNRNLVLFRTRRCGDTNIVPANDPCWEEESCANEYDCWDNDLGTIAVTLTTYDEKSGIIYDSDIELNSVAFYFTTSDGPLCNPPALTTNCVSTDVQNTMTHEIGHFVGLDHTNAVGSTMNPRAQTGEISKRSIDPGSRDFVCSEAYPKGMASQACVHPTSDANLGRKAQVGCASVGAEAWLPALAGWALLLARRRRGGRS
ncbi:myxosortase-dependent metalloprotease, MXAN_2677/MXAN_2678 family [Hyalangium gracile]|uniref:myxosortase-dependent metalloprotease, MXAN_2677/MXAN_2678 family n=1 Tax=Hyalangium gracile TaxID=394092 RepID=UPI001CCFEC9D|nr:myxosortase-dependent metalloprotease, MXAN_2677/MXAN_2678 family [Hyalangium gracile]